VGALEDPGATAEARGHAAAALAAAEYDAADADFLALAGLPRLLHRVTAPPTFYLYTHNYIFVIYTCVIMFYFVLCDPRLLHRVMLP
jgi:hypothetical protein